MQYRSVSDLNDIIIANCHRIPKNVSLIVGVPRSGMLAANLVALHSNLPMTDLEGYTAGHVMRSGSCRGKFQRGGDQDGVALVIDDSLLSGREMDRARQKVSAAGLESKTRFSAVLCHPEKTGQVDLAFDTCDVPRVFEWNLMHGHMLDKSCVDIDGVLCLDPTHEQNDDSIEYRKFLKNASPLYLPSAKVKKLVTCRLEKYRGETEDWMARHGVVYDELIMMQYNTAGERRAAKAYASYKADVFKSCKDSILFIESSDRVAQEIAKLSGKPAISTDSQICYQPNGLPLANQKARKTLQRSLSLMQRAKRKASHILEAMVKNPIAGRN